MMDQMDIGASRKMDSSKHIEGKKKPITIRLLEELYLRCCTLREFGEEFVKLEPGIHGDANPEYEQFLDSVIVGTSLPTVADREKSRGTTVADVDQFDRILNGFQYSFVRWRDKTLPKLPIFDRQLYLKLYCDFGLRWFIYLFNNCGLFAKVSKRGCFWQIGGRPANEQYYQNLSHPITEGATTKRDLSPGHEEQKLDDSPPIELNSIMNGLEDNKIVCWRKLLCSRDYRPGFSRRSLVDQLSREERDNSVTVRLIQAVWPSRKYLIEDTQGHSSIIHRNKLSELFNQFLDNHQKFDFNASVLVHCPITRSTEGVVPVELKKVVRFAKSVIFKTFPLQLLGSRRNQVEFQKFVGYIFRLGLDDQPSVKHLLWNMNVEDCCSWINGEIETTVAEKYHLLKELLVWILNDYIFICLASFFYVTEMDGESKQLFAYQKVQWKDVEKRAFEKLIDSETFRLMEDCEAEFKMQFNNFNLKRLRFVPKKVPTVELRPILISKRKQIEDNSDKRAKLKKDLEILNHILRSDVKYRGCSIPHRTKGPQTFHDLWQNFVQKVKANDITQLYFVKLDIKDCFTRIDHNKLLTVLKHIAAEFKSKEVWLRPCYVLKTVSGKPKVTYKRIAGPPLTSFSDVCSCDDEKNIKSVIVNLNRLDTESVVGTVERVTQEVRKNVVQFNRLFYHQIRGVSQGGCLSQSLCNIYFGHMEQCPPINAFVPEGENELLVRFVDDYLFVSPDRDRAEQFKLCLDQGLAAYSSCSNDRKSLANFECSWSHTATRYITYSGFQIDTETLEMSVDYSRNAGKSLSHRFTVVAGKGLPGIKQRLFRSACLNDKWILFDGRSNRRMSIVKNLYQFFLMLILRLHSALSRLPKCDRLTIRENPNEVVDVVMECVNYITRQLGKKRKRGVIDYPFKLATVKWICLQAAANKFRRHRLQYLKLFETFSDMKCSQEKEINLSKKKRNFFMKIIGKFPRKFKEMTI